MTFINSTWAYMTHPKRIIYDLIAKYGSDKLYLRFCFHTCMGYWMDFDNPKTYNEKLQWLKLYDRKDIYTTMVDKYAVKPYVANIISEKYIIPTLGVWDSFDDIDFDSLPNQFVLKCTHDSGGLVICTDKESLDKNTAKCKIENSLMYDYYKKSREWPYKNVPRRIIAEKYMEDEETGELRDYKFFCFDGEVKAMYIATERQNNNDVTRFDFFDRDFNHIDCVNGHPMADIPPAKPMNYELMIKLAEKLSQDIPHARIDFFECNGKVYFGEITLYHFGGLVRMEPYDVDLMFGSWLTLPNKQ